MEFLLHKPAKHFMLLIQTVVSCYIFYWYLCCRPSV